MFFAKPGTIKKLSFKFYESNFSDELVGLLLWGVSPWPLVRNS